MTIIFEDVVGDLKNKGQCRLHAISRKPTFSSTPSVKTVLRMACRNVRSVQLSSFIVKNYDNQSGVVFDVKDTDTFAVQKVKFPGIENQVFANSCRSDYGEVPCSQVFHYKDEGPDASIVIMMGIIVAVTGEIFSL